MSTPAGSDPNPDAWGGQPAQPDDAQPVWPQAAEAAPAWPQPTDAWGNQQNAWQEPAQEPAPAAAPATDAGTDAWGNQQNAWGAAPSEPAAQQPGLAQQNAFQDPPAAATWPATPAAAEPAPTEGGSQPEQPTPPTWGAQTAAPAWGAQPEPQAAPVWSAQPAQPAPPVWGSQPEQQAAPTWDAQPTTAQPAPGPVEPAWGAQDAQPAWGNPPAEPAWAAAQPVEPAAAPVWQNAQTPVAPEQPAAWDNPAAQAAWPAQPAQPQAPAWESQAADGAWPAQAPADALEQRPTVVVGDSAPQPPSWAKRRPISELRPQAHAPVPLEQPGAPAGDPAWMIWKKIPDSVWERISPRTAIFAAVGAALFLGVLLFTPNLFGSGDSGAANAAAVQPAPEGSTKVGTISMVLPEAIGPWTAQDQTLLDATVAESAKNGTQLSSVAGYNSVNGAAVVTSVLPAGSHNGLATVDESITRLATALNVANTPVVATWTGGSLPSRALDLDMGDGRTIAIYIELPDGSLLAVSVSGPTSAFASGELASAALSAVYTG